MEPASRWNPQWRAAWADEIERRRQRLESGEDRELTLDEFFSDWLDEAERRDEKMESGEDPGLSIEEFFSDDLGEMK